jgi:hypothetical protein
MWDIRSKVQIHCMGGHDQTVCSLLTQAVDPQVRGRGVGEWLVVVGGEGGQGGGGRAAEGKGRSCGEVAWRGLEGGRAQEGPWRCMLGAVSRAHRPVPEPAPSGSLGRPQCISGSHDSTIRLWDIRKNKAFSVLTNHKKSVRAMCMHPQVGRAAVAGARPAAPGLQGQLWIALLAASRDDRSAPSRPSWPGHTRQDFAFASASAENTKKWALPEGTFIHNFLSEQRSIVNCAAINEEGVVATGGRGGAAVPGFGDDGFEQVGGHVEFGCLSKVWRTEGAGIEEQSAQSSRERARECGDARGALTRGCGCDSPSQEATTARCGGGTGTAGTASSRTTPWCSRAAWRARARCSTARSTCRALASLRPRATRPSRCGSRCAARPAGSAACPGERHGCAGERDRCPCVPALHGAAPSRPHVRVSLWPQDEDATPETHPGLPFRPPKEYKRF